MIRTIFAFAAVLAFGMPAYSQSFYVNSSDGTIAELDTATGTLSNSFSLTNVFLDIAIDDAGTGYGVTSSKELYSIDFDTMVTSLVGSTNITADIAALAFGTSGLYGAGGDQFYSIDTLTGNATGVGSSIDATFNTSGDIAFAGGDLFYGTSSNSCDGGTGDCLWAIDASTGEGTVVGSTEAGTLSGLAFVGGELFGLSAFENKVYQLDTSTGAGTEVASYDFGGGAIAFGAAAAPSAVPEVSATGSLAAVSTLLAFIAFLRERRRRPSEGPILAV